MPIKPPIQAWPRGVWTIQFASNLRTDQRGWVGAMQSLRPVSPNLAILGNLGNVSTAGGVKEIHRFFRDLNKTWTNIFWVPGRSEYSCVTDRKYYKPNDMFKLRDRVQEIAPESKVTVMDQTEVILEDESIVILGITGWSPVNIGSFWITDSKGQHIATASDIADLQDQDRAWLKSRIIWWRKNRPGMRIVVLSHDAPELMNVSEDVTMWLSGKGPNNSNVSGRVNRNTFFCVNEYGIPHYLPDRSTSIPICLR